MTRAAAAAATPDRASQQWVRALGAFRDFGLLLGALTLARLASAFVRGGRQPVELGA